MLSRRILTTPLVRCFVAKMHHKPQSTEAYAEKFLLSYELFKSRTESKQPPLVVKHGLLGSKINWRAIGRNLNRSGRDVLTLDLRNHGRSPHSNFMGYEIMATDVIHTLEKVLPTHRKFDLMGHSMGGKVAMVLALKHPELVSRLIVIDILPEHNRSTGNFAAEALFDALDNVDVDRSKPLPDARGDVVRQLFQMLNDQTTPENIRFKICEWLATNLDWTPENGIFWKSNLKVLRATLEDILMFPKFDFQPFNKPVLFIQGKRSDVMKGPKRDEVARRYFPNAEFEVIQDAGHWVHYDKPFELIRTINNFLNSTSYS